MHGKSFLVALILFSFSFLTQSLSAENKLPVFVSIVPQKSFVQQIGGDLVDVQVMVKPGASPATYEPKPSQMAALSKSRLYFSIGVPFEEVWLQKIAAANPAMKVIHTDEGIRKLAMDAHHNEEEGNHDQGGLDPHIWLSPTLVKIQAATILRALVMADPNHVQVFETNCNRFISKINKLDSKLKETFKNRSGLKFLVFHPSWGYLAHDYNLKQLAIEIEGKDPKPAQLGKLIEHAREEDIKVIFVQPQFSSKSAKLIAGEINGQVVFADPLAEEWMTNLYDVAEKFRKALK